KSAQIREILISESAWEEMTCLFASSLGYRKAAKLLKETLEEEKATDIKLTDLALNNVNKKAENKA
ncbi:DUF892 family protein, partial [Escherichia coli]|uniref:DUF892 family protein n=1 Tax=Escherichia coli TaxID=562 RepID=UPI001FCEAEF2